MTTEAACELCAQTGGELIHRAAKFRIVLIDDAQYPGFCRVIWNDHVREMTDLAAPDRSVLMKAVCQVEDAVRAVMRPDKINLASLGNMTPHLHWHVIPRYAGDAHFPAPVWAQAQRELPANEQAARMALLPALRDAIVARLGPSI
jgi:diadenosine tetraphosphate (Ap4A) HIT family hydrolase